MSLKKIRSLWVELYVIIMLAVFPLYVHNKYFDMQIAKFTFFYIATLIMVVVFFILSVTDIIKGNTKFKSILSSPNRIPCIAAVIFAISAIISTLQSDYLYEAFWGNEGRNSGLFTLLLYIALFIIIALNFRIREYHIMIALTAALVVSGLGITDYFGIDLLNFKDGITEARIAIFTSTFGNINYYTAYVAMMAVMAGIMTATSKKHIKTCFYYIAFIVIITALIFGVSDNAYISMAVFFGFAPLYLFKSKRGFLRYIILAATFLTVIKLTVLLSNVYVNELLPLQGVYNLFADYKVFTYIAVLLWILALALCIIMRRYKEELSPWLMRTWAVIIVLIITFIAYALIDVNINGNRTGYGFMTPYLVIDDSWGTNRGFIWVRSLKMYSGFSTGHKIFGYGPDTFAILSHFSEYRDESIRLYREFYDSVHNEYIQYLLTIGVFGLLAYFGIIFTSLICVFKRKDDIPAAKAAGFAAMAYLAQAAVSISTPVSAPYMFILLAAALSAGREANNG